MIELNNYPKAKELFVQWCIEMYKLIFPDAELKGKEAERFAELGLQGNIRNLFSFFDYNKLYIDIYHTEDIQWYYDINSFGNADSSEIREEAELKAFEKSFSLLEKQLNETI